MRSDRTSHHGCSAHVPFGGTRPCPHRSAPSGARGWSATVDGNAAPIEGGNFLFRAVRVHAGANTVAFGYHPFGIPWLVALSWLTLAAVGVWSFVARARRAPSTPAPDVVSEADSALAVDATTAADFAPPSQPTIKKRRKRK